MRGRSNMGASDAQIFGAGADARIVKEGFLMKRSSSLRHDWKRRWFFIRGGKLFYQRESKEQASQSGAKADAHALFDRPVLVCEVMLCKARECVKSTDLRFSFEVFSANRRSYLLQASSRSEMLSWMAAIQGEIENQLHMQPGPDGAEASGEGATARDADDMNEFAEELRALSPCCADCGAPSPQWASINLGLMVCLQCSGVHRSLGVQVRGKCFRGDGVSLLLLPLPLRAGVRT